MVYFSTLEIVEFYDDILTTLRIKAPSLTEREAQDYLALATKEIEKDENKSRDKHKLN
jgi:hypothetical protein